MKKKLIFLIPIILGVMAIGAGVLTFLLSQPEEVVEEGNLANIEWYSLEEKEFIINTVEEFYEFAKLSQFYDFKKQTVKLGADLVLNEGNVADWGEKAPENKWYGIQGFAGTFDGQGHSLSGMYSLKHTGKVGLFIDTQPNCKIKNFRILNSYFEADSGSAVGSVVSEGAGNFSNIYSDAIVITNNKGAGGLIGKINSGGASSFMAYTHSISNCWFDGEVRLTDKAEGMRAGGIVGIAGNGTVSIEHCLNTGTISGYLNHMGGIVGYIENNSGCAVYVKDSFNSGLVKTDYNGLAIASIIGRVGIGVSAVIENTAATTESRKDGVHADGSVTGYVISRPEKDLIGYGGYKWTNLDFENYWAIRMEDTPILKYFADDVPDLTGVVKEFDTSWYSASQAEFEITTRAQLIGMNLLANETDFAGQTIKLGADIVMNEGKASNWAKEAPDYFWTPIASFRKPFQGTIDGQGHSISGLYISDDVAGTGFIRCMGNDAGIKNIKFLNSYVESTYEPSDNASIMGGIVGRGAGIFENIYSDTIVKSVGGYAGGFVGQSAGPMTMRNCWFDGSLTVTGENSQRIGGFIGNLQNPFERVLEHCLFSGDITIPVNHVGGFIGNVEAEKLTLIIRDSLSVGTITSVGGWTDAVGAIIGRLRGVSTVTVSATAAAKEMTKNAIHAERDANLKGAVSQTEREKLIGTGGYEWTELDFKNYWSIVKGDTPILKHFASASPSTQGLVRKVDTSWYDTSKDTYIIDTLAKLLVFNSIAQTNDFAGKTIKLGADITVNTGDAKEWRTLAPEYQWLPAGSFGQPFVGIFDGQGHTISGLYIKDDAAGAALFRCTGKGSAVKNLKIVNSYIESTVEKDNAAIMGTIAGRANGGTFENIYADTIMVSYGGFAGGFIGQSAATMNMSNCWFDGSLTLTGKNSIWAGGLIGSVQNPQKYTIAHCLNTGSIVSQAVQVGGLFGIVQNEGCVITIEDCFNAGIVQAGGTNGVGSIIGRLHNKVVANVMTTVATTESCGTGIYKEANAILNGGVLRKSKDLLTGNGGYLWTELDFKNYWSIVEGGTPILKCFAKTSPAVSGTRMVDTTWYKAEASTYDIDTIAKLNGLSVLAQGNNFAGKTINLKANITLNTGDAANWATTVPTYSWAPIGGFRNPFMGTFNGNGHTIDGLYVNVTEGGGLFACIGETGKVSDLKITNSYIKGGLIVGGLVGRGAGIYENIYVNAIVTSIGEGYLGGIIGQGTNAVKMTNCQNAGPVTARGNGMKVAGLIGSPQGNKTVVYNCLNTGTIVCEAKSHVGGLLGHASYGEFIVDSCLNTGDVNTKTGVAGSIIGRLQGNNTPVTATVTNTYATTESCGQTIYADVNSVLNGVTQTGGSVTGVVDAYSKDVLQNYGSVVYTNLDFENYWTAMKGAPAQLQDYATGEQLTVTADMIPDTSWYDESKTEFVIDTVGKLYGFQQLSKTKNFQGKTVKLAQSFTFTTEDVKTIAKENILWPWAAISPSTCGFAGTFDGQNNTLSGIYTNGDKFIGVFGKITGGTVKNLKVENSYFAGGRHQVGSIAGVASGTFENIDVNATVSATGGHVGGFFGQHLEGTLAMTDCHFKGAVSSGSSIVGGIIGTNGGTTTTMTNCSNSATVDAKNGDQAGGFIGRGQDGAVVTISNSVNDGKVTATASSVGGFVGYHVKGSVEIRNSQNKKDIYGGQHTVGGFVGNANDSVTIIECSNTGNVTGKSGQQVGGIIGNISSNNTTPNLTVKKTTNSGTVAAGYSNAGGIVGQVYSATSVTIEDCKNTGDVSLAQNMNCAGIVGFLKATTSSITNCVNEGNTSGVMDRVAGIVGSVDHGAGRTTISGCKNSGNVTSTSASNYEGVGGIVARYYGTSLHIINCENAGDVSITGGGNGYLVGGILGKACCSGVTIEYCLNSGAVSSKTASHVGGIVGFVRDGNATISNCFNSGKIGISAGQPGGSILGRNYNGTVTIKDTYATTESCVQQVYADSYISDGTTSREVHGNATGFVGATTAANFTGLKALTNAPKLDWNTYWTPMAQGTPQLKSHKDGIAVDVAWYNTNKNASSISIATPEQLMTYNEMVATNPASYLNKNVTLTADITINGGNNDDWATKAPKYKWVPLFNHTTNAYVGTFNGGGHTISGLYTKGSDAYAGLFRVVGAGAKVQNLKLVNSYFSGGLIVGGIAGRGEGNFENLYVDAIVVSTGVGENGGYVGGIIGQSVGGTTTLTKCWNAGSVTSTDAKAYRVGGLIGVAQGSATNIYHCLNSGAVTCAYKTHVGGLIGNLPAGTVTIDASLNTGALNAHSEAAGSIIGRVHGGRTANITNTYAMTESCTGATVYADGNTTVTINGVTGTSGSNKTGQVSRENLTGTTAQGTNGAKNLRWETGYFKTTTSLPILDGFGF